MIMSHCHKGITEEGMMAEWRLLENLSLPEINRAISFYKAGKAQKKALKKERDRFVFVWVRLRPPNYTTVG